MIITEMLKIIRSELKGLGAKTAADYVTKALYTIENQADIQDDIPPSPAPIGRPREIAIDQLQPGQSLFVQLKPGKQIKTLHTTALSAIRSWTRAHPDTSFSALRQPDGVRIWRIK